jgi:UDP-GlcNAc:undecaprenyl-phosphate GlcNAc-1-phosphate transferase
MSGRMSAAVKTFFIAFVLCPIFRDVFRSYNIVDRPGLRKFHAYPIPRIGGIPLAIAYAFVLLSFPAFIGSYESPAWKFLPAAAMIFFTGLVDDVLHLKPVYKLCGEILAAAIAFWSGLRIEQIGDTSVPFWLGLPVTILWLLLSTNAFNLIDGLDGLCAGLAFIATLTFFAVAVMQGNVSLQYATAPFAGALLGFLCYNLNPATVFLGDSGALLIGFLLGCYGITAIQDLPTLPGLIVPLLALAVPLLDVFLSIVRRFLKSRPIFGADRGHLHHRLLDRGLSARRAVFVLYLVAAVGAGFAILLSVPSTLVKIVCIIASCLSLWVGVRWLRYAEFEVTGKLLFGEFRKIVQLQVRLEELGSALRRCTTEDEWWAALVHAAREAGWTRMQWIGDPASREQVWKDQPPEWSFTIALDGSPTLANQPVQNQSVQIQGLLQPGHPALDMLGIAAVLRSSFAALPRKLE